ncbi:MAG TPA: hypothetical protein VMG82_37880 [Candidatus Sulfotelmatobacter sp.]|nr:hypothetical protein [Candidatus Sulfotelmatobacter sp.]
MPQAVDNVAATLEQLTEQVRELERRVAVLEGQRETSSAQSDAASTPLQRPRPPATWRGFPPLETSSGAVPIIGRAVLGMAGAYLLRALAESSSIPKMPVLLVAILYACFWMVWAVRVHSTSRFASGVYAVTSALILSPLLWECTVRFQVLSPVVAAAVTVAFVVLAIALAWREDLQLIPWVATLGSVITALALIIETHELVPLTAALLAVALITESTACLGHRLTLRAIPALAADFAVWLLVFILASETVPEGYHPVWPGTIAILCFGLLTIYAASIGIRSFVLRQAITPFEIGQAVVAFVIASYGVLRALQSSITRPLGAVFLLLAAICYWGTLSRFTEESQVRNRRVSAIWAAALILSGCWLLVPANLQIPFLTSTALAATLVYNRTRKLSLGMHASIYLAAASVVSTLPAYLGGTLTGDVPGAPDWRIWTLLAAAGLCYGIGSSTREDRRSYRLLWVTPVIVVTLTAAALAVSAIVSVGFRHHQVPASTLSVIRTVIICGVALGLAILGSRLERAELGWLAYTAVALGTLKLLLEDLRFGNAASLVVSLLFYGLILILLPWLSRKLQRSS